MVLTCSNVAKKLGVNHVCNRKFFLLKKNRAKHKLRKFRLYILHEAEFIRQAFMVHPTICRSTRTPVDCRIIRLMGTDEFEICKNYKGYWKVVTSQEQYQDTKNLCKQFQRPPRWKNQHHQLPPYHQLLQHQILLMKISSDLKQHKTIQQLQHFLLLQHKTLNICCPIMSMRIINHGSVTHITKSLVTLSTT